MTKIKITEEQKLKIMLVNACEELFPDDVTVGDVLEIGGTLIVRAIMRVQEQKNRFELLHKLQEVLESSITNLSLRKTRS